MQACLVRKCRRTDKARLFLYMVPAFAVVSTAALQELSGHVAPRRFFLFLGTIVLLHLYLGNHLQPMESMEVYLDRFVPIHGPWGGAMGFDRAILVTILSIVQYLCGGFMLIAPYIFYQDPYHCTSSTVTNMSCHEHVCSLPKMERS